MPGIDTGNRKAGGRKARRGRASGLRIAALVPWHALRILLVMGMAIKALLILQIGEERYRARLAAYQGQELGERIGRFVMQPDPVSLRLRDMVAERLRPARARPPPPAPQPRALPGQGTGPRVWRGLPGSQRRKSGS